MVLRLKQGQQHAAIVLASVPSSASSLGLDLIHSCQYRSATKLSAVGYVAGIHSNNNEILDESGGEQPTENDKSQNSRHEKVSNSLQSFSLGL